MTIRFRCKCGRKFEVADNMAGRKARCTDCGLTFLVPSPAGGGGASKSGASAKPTQPGPAQDDSPLAMAARAAQQAAAHAGPHGAKPSQPTPAAPKPHAPKPATHAPRPQAPPMHAPKPATQVPAQTPGQAQRPKTSRPAAPPARPGAPAPQAPAGTCALQDDDDVPVARLATPRPGQAQHPMHLTHLGKRKPKLVAVQLVAGISSLACLVVGVDAMVTMIGAFGNGARGLQLIYGAMALFAGVGIIVAMAAASGSRVCIGILLGGAAVNVLGNGPYLMMAGFGKWDSIVAMGKDAPLIFGIAGALAILLGIVYILVPLLSQPVRKFIGASPAGFVVGAVLGFLLGPIIASTAQPSWAVVPMRAFTTSPVIMFVTLPSAGSSAKGGGGPTGGLVVATNKNREQMADHMKDIYDAMRQYAQQWHRVPDDIGSLVDEVTLPARLFYCPSKGYNVKTSYDPQIHKFLREPDVIYLFKGSRSEEQISKAPNPEQLIVAYSSPDCKLGGDGALVMRLPGLITPKPIEWLDKATFEKQLAATRQWLKDNPAPAEKAPDVLPGSGAFGSGGM